MASPAPGPCQCARSQGRRPPAGRGRTVTVTGSVTLGHGRSLALRARFLDSLPLPRPHFKLSGICGAACDGSPGSCHESTPARARAASAVSHGLQAAGCCCRRDGGIRLGTSVAGGGGRWLRPCRTGGPGAGTRTRPGSAWPGSSVSGSWWPGHPRSQHAAPPPRLRRGGSHVHASRWPAGTAPLRRRRARRRAARSRGTHSGHCQACEVHLVSARTVVLGGRWSRCPSRYDETRSPAPAGPAHAVTVMRNGHLVAGSGPE